MLTEEEKILARKLYSMLYNGANIYNAKRGTKNRGAGSGDPVFKFGMIVRELKQHMKEIENV